MKNNFTQILWMIILLITLVGLSIWAICYLDKVENQISVFGIIAIIIAAFTSVLTVSLNNKKAKEKEYELMILKEKQIVFEHFYNSLFEMLNNTKKGKSGLTKKAIDEMMLFKKGLMNWGSENVINEYIAYDNKLLEKPDEFSILTDGNKFLIELRKEMGFSDSKKLNLMSIILTAEARKQMLESD